MLRESISIQAMCPNFKLHRSGLYGWLDNPLSNHAIEDQRLTVRLQEFYIAVELRMAVSVSKETLVMLDEIRSARRVAKIVPENRLKAQIGYRRRYMEGGKLGTVAGNILDRKFSPDMPNQA